jgi:hypothetical protein
MEQYESNSHKSRGATPKAEIEPVKKKEVKQVATSAKEKKPSVGSKLQKIFLPEDVTDVKEWLIYDIFIPAAGNLICDTVNQVFGRRVVRKGSILGGGGRVNYQAASYPRSSMAPRRQSTFDYNDICVTTSAEAHAILDELDALMEQYHVVSLADLYEAAGISCDYTYNNYGWKDISDARVVRDTDGWVLRFPKAMPIT